MKDTVMPKIVCLCGSTKFWTEFNRVIFQETIAGNICVIPGVYAHSVLSFQSHKSDPSTKRRKPLVLDDRQKAILDELHKRKIDLADEVFIVNHEGYIGDSTISEIKYALESRKPIRWLEPMVTIDAIETWDVDTYIESLIND